MYAGMILGFIPLCKYGSVLYILLLCLSLPLGMHGGCISKLTSSSSYFFFLFYPPIDAYQNSSSVFPQNLQDKPFLLLWLQKP